MLDEVQKGFSSLLSLHLLISIAIVHGRREVQGFCLIDTKGTNAIGILATFFLSVFFFLAAAAAVKEVRLGVNGKQPMQADG